MSVFPEWIDDYRIEEDLFAEAYESTGPQLRAWLKKTIAQVYAVNSPEAPRKSWIVNTWRGGFETEISTAPLDWAILLLDKTCVSPVRMLATLVPAFAADMNNVLAVFVGDGVVPQSVLAAFELAGQEDVLLMPEARVAELLSSTADSEACGAVLDMRVESGSLLCPAQVRYWRAPRISSICICKDEESPDMDVLEFVHPDVDFREIEESALHETQADAAVVPSELVGDALTSFRIVLAHGQEGCWIWNGFGSKFFRQESVALAAAE